MRAFSHALGIAIVLSAIPFAHVGRDAPAGKSCSRRQCAACHTTTVGQNDFGPSLEAWSEASPAALLGTRR